MAIAGMAICALIGIGAMLLFVTVGWPGNIGRYPITVFIVSVIGFLACASIAVLAAARDTYPQAKRRRDSSPPPHD
jgi:hypothetical protein